MFFKAEKNIREAINAKKRKFIEEQIILEQSASLLIENIRKSESSGFLDSSFHETEKKRLLDGRPKLTAFRAFRKKISECLRKLKSKF